MSHIAQSNAWEWIRAHSDDERLRAPERLVLLTLANRLNHKTADLHPSVARIAEDTRLSTSSCRRALRTLEDLGAVTSRRSYGSDGRQLPNDYEISSGLMTRSQDTAPREDHGDSAALDVGAVTLTPPPGHTDTPPRSEGPPPPVTLTAPPGHTDRPTKEEQQGKSNTPPVAPRGRGARARKRPLKDPAERPSAEALRLASIWRELRPRVTTPPEADAGWIEHLLTVGPATTKTNRNPTGHAVKAEHVEGFLRAMWGPTATFTPELAEAEQLHPWHRYVANGEALWRNWSGATSQIREILEGRARRPDVAGGWQR